MDHVEKQDLNRRQRGESPWAFWFWVEPVEVNESGDVCADVVEEVLAEGRTRTAYRIETSWLSPEEAAKLGFERLDDGRCRAVVSPIKLEKIGRAHV